MLNDLKYGDDIISIIKARRLVLFAERSQEKEYHLIRFGRGVQWKAGP